MTVTNHLNSVPSYMFLLIYVTDFAIFILKQELALGRGVS